MSDTPRTDAERISAYGEGGIEGSIGFTAVPTEFARALERENAALRQKLTEWAREAHEDLSFWVDTTANTKEPAATIAKWKARETEEKS